MRRVLTRIKSSRERTSRRLGRHNWDRAKVDSVSGQGRFLVQSAMAVQLRPLNCYRIWYGNAPCDPALQKYEDQLAKKPKISVPTMILHGDSDALYPSAASEGQESLFTGFYERRTLEGVGDCPPKEGPRPFVKGIEDLMAAAKKI
jgi:pimeloyl-ACP methyl ester carboxylesterase